MGGFALVASYFDEFLHFLVGGTGAGVAAWLLASVFVLSGSFKLRRPLLAAKAIVDFGVARQVTPTFGWMLGFGEVLLAGAIIVSPKWGSVGAAVVLWVFAALIARSIASGRQFACFCFGDKNIPLSAWTFFRTAVLAAVATCLVFVSPEFRRVDVDVVIQIAISAGLLGVVALLRYLPGLLQWNSQIVSNQQQEVRA